MRVINLPNKFQIVIERERLRESRSETVEPQLLAVSAASVGFLFSPWMLLNMFIHIHKHMSPKMLMCSILSRVLCYSSDTKSHLPCNSP